MSVKIIMGVIIGIIQCIFFLDHRKNLIYKNGIVLETSISEYKYEEDDALKRIVQNTKNKVFYLLLITGIIGFGLLFVPSTLSMEIISMYIVLFSDMIGMIILTQQGIDQFRKVYYTKYTENQVEEKFIDLSLVNQRTRFGIRKSLFAIPIAIYLMSMILYHVTSKSFGAPLIAILAITNLTSDFFMDWYIRRYLVYAYTDSHTKNVTLNREIIERISKKNYVKSILNGSATFFYTIFLWRSPYDQQIIYLYLFALFATNAWMIFQFTESGRKELKEISYPSQSGQDHYWYAWGYYNPKDQRIFVPDRKRTNLVINFARPGGKIIMLIVVAFIFVPILFALPSPNKITYEKDNLKISSYGYHETVAKEDIEKITLLQDLPSGNIIRTNGVGTDTRSVGNFSIQSIGRVKFFLYSSSEKIIELKTKDLPVYLNDETDEKTDHLYQKIKKWERSK